MASESVVVVVVLPTQVILNLLKSMTKSFFNRITTVVRGARTLWQ